MNLRINGLYDRMRGSYDRVLAFVTVTALVVTMILLFLQSGSLREQQAAFSNWMRDLRPEREQVDAATDLVYERAMQALQTPAQLVTGADRVRWFLVPESRFSCAECGHPVPSDAERCPFCDTLVTPPEPETIDHDGDGMPTRWEVAHGLDPNDATDAGQDWDKDGFTNLEEYQFDTNPQDASSHPPLLDWLIVDRIEGQRFGLQFRSRVRTRDGDYRFGINYQLPNGDTKTDFVKIGGEVSGFVIVSYEERIVPATPPTPGNVDRSELTIRTPRGDAIVLVKDQPVLHVEQTAHLRMGRPLPEHSFGVRVDESFTLGGGTYRVIGIDAEQSTVIVERLSDNLRYTITDDIRPRPFVRAIEPEDRPAVEADMENEAFIPTEEPGPFMR